MRIDVSNNAMYCFLALCFVAFMFVVSYGITTEDKGKSQENAIIAEMVANGAHPMAASCAVKNNCKFGDMDVLERFIESTRNEQ